MIPGIAVSCIILSFIVAYFGRNRSMTFWGYFFASLLLTPLIGLLLVIVSAKRENTTKS
jgi:hypothetical protein